MTQVVQATCPGCKSVLRIPSEWIAQPIRCKGCGTVLQARQPAAAPAAITAPPQAPPRPEEKTPIPRPGPRRAAPPPPPLPGRPVPAAIMPPPPITAPPPAPLAAPVRASGGSPFDFEEAPEVAVEVPSIRKRRKKSGTGTWIGLGVAVVLMLVTGGVVFALLPKIKERMQAGVVEPDDPEEETPTPGKGVKKGTRGGKGTAPITGPALFPRRALIISVHNYLYANPIGEGASGTANIPRLMAAMNNGLRIPLNQITHLSDANVKEPRPPLKSVIEQGLVNFLKTTRKQDRIVVVFIGHTKEIDDKPYLVPLEGEMDNAGTLIPLDWVYKQLADCPARQKILVLDGNRFNSAQGEERPAAGPMGEKFHAALKAPPSGVQVLAACSAGQKSQEFDEAPLGLFLDSLRTAMSPEKNEKGALTGRIQKHDDLIPLDVLHETLVARMGAEVDRRKAGKQVPILAGKPPATGTEYDRTEPLAAAPAMPVIKGSDTALVKAIMNEISLPPLKGGETMSQDVSFSLLPPFPEESLKEYLAGDLPADSKLRKAVQEARATLWAVSTAKPPPELQAEVQRIRAKLNVDLSIMRERYSKPGEGMAEVRFKNGVFEDGKAMSRIVARLENVLDMLEEAGKEEKEKAPKRWQANYVFIFARFRAQLAYLEEYQGLLGQMRREFPEHNPMVHTGFRMAAKEKPSDAASKKHATVARKGYATLVEENPKTPWEVLAKREKLTALGLEWQAY